MHTYMQKFRMNGRNNEVVWDESIDIGWKLEMHNKLCIFLCITNMPNKYFYDAHWLQLTIWTAIVKEEDRKEMVTIVDADDLYEHNEDSLV